MEMQTSTNKTFGEFSIGSVLTRSFSFFFKNLGVFLGLTFIAQLLSLLVHFTMSGSRANQSIQNLLLFALNMVFQGASAYAVYQIYKGHTASIGESLTRGLSRIFPMIFSVLLSTLALLIPILPLLFIPFLFSPHNIEVLFMITIPISLFFILKLLSMWWVVAPACAVESLGPVESMRRSAELTEGCRLKVFGLIALMFILFVLLMSLTNYLMLFVFRVGRLASVILAALISLFPYALGSVIVAVGYFELRTSKEGLDIESLTNVFD